MPRMAHLILELSQQLIVTLLLVQKTIESTVPVLRLSNGNTIANRKPTTAKLKRVKSTGFDCLKAVTDREVTFNHFLFDQPSTLYTIVAHSSSPERLTKVSGHNTLARITAASCVTAALLNT